MNLALPGRLLLCWLGLGSALLRTGMAQDGAAGADPLAGLVPLDRVVATVNDAVILQREILTLTVSEIRAREQERGGPLSAGERSQIFFRNLEGRIDEHALAQAAGTLGLLPPERVEEIFQSQLLEEERDLVRKLGTLQRVTEEQARQGRNWETFVRDQRVSKLSDLTRSLAVQSRLNNQSNLFITPRMMRTFYLQNRAQFVRESRAVLGCVAFAGADAAAAAAAAKAVWEQEPLSPEGIVERFSDRGAMAPETLLIDEAARKSRRPDQVAFAMQGPAGLVSEPIEDTRAVRLWKVLDFAEAREDRFEDPKVQALIRNLMEQQVYDRLLTQTRKRSRERTQVWQPPDLRRN